MGKDTSETRTLLLMALLAVWVAIYGYSLIFLMTTPVSDDGFTRGLNRLSGFLGWQGLAGMVAFACWGIGWSFPKSSGIRRMSGVPLGMAVALLIVGVGMVMFGQ